MQRKPQTAIDKLASLEQQRNQLIKQRHNELINIIDNNNALLIDDRLLSGFLVFISNDNNKDHPIIKEFMELATRSKTPSKTKQSNKK